MVPGEIPILRAISRTPMPDAKAVFTCSQISFVIFRRITFTDHITRDNRPNCRDCRFYGLSSAPDCIHLHAAKAAVITFAVVNCVRIVSIGGLARSRDSGFPGEPTKHTINVTLLLRE